VLVNVLEDKYLSYHSSVEFVVSTSGKRSPRIISIMLTFQKDKLLDNFSTGPNSI